VLYLDGEEGFLRPVASDFEAFLRHCFLVGRYETEEQWLESGNDREEEQERTTFLRRLNLPEELNQVAVPRNDTELYSYLASSDEQDAVSLCHLGCVQRAAGNWERALDFYHRASEATPWFGDPPYLIADIHREREQYERAVECWWRVVQRPVSLCTRTWEWDLGEEHPEADIYEVAADALAQWSDHADPAYRATPLWRVVLQDDPYNPDAREELAKILLKQEDWINAEREYLNALTLCREEEGKQPLRCCDALIALYERQGRRRDAALLRHDRKLPRP
jgi:tetratricopeptide (TPR) repeat protein